MISLYIHIPFCERKCFYCSFVVSIGQEQRVDQYLQCLSLEAAQYNKTHINTIYIGGGTPSFLNQTQLEQLFKMIGDNFVVSDDIEVTFETNPESLNKEKLILLKRLGVNRLSLGVQSLNDQYLKYLGRNHSASKVFSIVEEIRKCEFNSWNLDLMYGFPNQTLDEIEEDVLNISRLGSDHLSLYTLTIEENSRFFAQKTKLAIDDVQAKQYQLVLQLLVREGFKQYEISNFARDNQISKHNLNYWRGGNYVGLGVGAHSHTNGRRFWNGSKLLDYMEKVQKNLSAEEGFELLTKEQQFKEVLLFGLRMNEGVDLIFIENQFSYRLSQNDQQIINQLIEAEFVSKEGARIKVTDKGRVILDEICSRLV